MSSFLISLRDYNPINGLPGTGMGEKTAYFEMSDRQNLYYKDEQIPQQTWLERVGGAGTSVLVFVHGFADNAEKVVERHHSIKPFLAPDICLVSFDWPAGNFPEPYKRDKANAALSAPKLMSGCLNVLLSRFQAQKVHLFAHSMGAYVTETAFQEPMTLTSKINRVMMAAADVDQLNYVGGSTFLTNFLGKCTDLTAYWSTDDMALQDSERMNKYTPLGLKGYPEPDTPTGCYGVQCTTYYNRYVKFPGQDDTFSHVWYLLYRPTAPLMNDFYTDMNRFLPSPPSPPARHSQTRARGIMLRRQIP